MIPLRWVSDLYCLVRNPMSRVISVNREYLPVSFSRDLPGKQKKGRSEITIPRDLLVNNKTRPGVDYEHLRFRSHVYLRVKTYRFIEF